MLSGKLNFEPGLSNKSRSNYFWSISINLDQRWSPTFKESISSTFVYNYSAFLGTTSCIVSPAVQQDISFRCFNREIPGNLTQLFPSRESKKCFKHIQLSLSALFSVCRAVTAARWNFLGKEHSSSRGLQGVEGHFSLLDFGSAFGLASFPGEVAAIPVSSFFPSAAHWKGMWASIRLCWCWATGVCWEMHCVGSPEPSPSFSAALWAHSFSLLRVVTSHIILTFRETQMQWMQEGSVGVDLPNCHQSWPQPMWCPRVVPKTLLECATPPEVSGYFQFLARHLHFAILAAQCCPEGAGCFQFVMLLSTEPSTPLTLKRNFKSVLPYTSYSYLRKRVLTHPETYL